MMKNLLGVYTVQFYTVNTQQKRADNQAENFANILLGGLVPGNIIL